MASLDRDDPVAAARDAVDRTVRALTAAGARDEGLAEFEPEHRRWGIRRPARLRPLGRVWRLGALLVGPSGDLFGTGRVVRAEQPARRSVVALAVAEHRAYQAAAIRGGFRTGDTVNFAAVPVDLAALAAGGASGPLIVRDGVVCVRWSTTQPDALAELSGYLADRAELLVHPPAGT